MKKYLITSQEFYTNNKKGFEEILSAQILKHQVDYILYRDKLNQNYDSHAKCFVEVCASYRGVKGFIHQKIDLAKTLGAKGVHLTSLQFDEITRAKQLGLEVIVSTHTHQEVLKAQTLGADAVTYSPIFTSPNKGVPKGIKDLEELLNKCDIKIFALGGIIDVKQLELIKNTNSYGFASIRYFY